MTFEQSGTDTNVGRNWVDIEREFRERFGEENEKPHYTGPDGSYSDVWFGERDILAFFKAKHDAYQQWLVEEIEKESEKAYQTADDAAELYGFEQGLSTVKSLIKSSSDIQELVKGNDD